MTPETIEQYRSAAPTEQRRILDNIIRDEMPFIRNSVHRFTKGRCREEDFEDLVQTGCMAVRRAAQTWDPNKSTWNYYGDMWIRTYLQKGAYYSALVRGQRFDRARGEFKQVQRAYEPQRSGSASDTDDEPPSLLDQIRNGKAKDVDQEVLVNKRLDAERCMAQLNAQEKQVVSLFVFEEKTPREVGAELGIPSSRAKTIRDKAYAKMRRFASR